MVYVVLPGCLTVLGDTVNGERAARVCGVYPPTSSKTAKHRCFPRSHQFAGFEFLPRGVANAEHIDLFLFLQNSV